MFNPAPHIQQWPIHDGHSCFVVDNALLDPHAWLRVANTQAAAFAETGHNAYPGPELRLPDAITGRLQDYFNQHFRRQLGARRVQRAYSRLAMVTAQPHTLQPRQWLCHRDRMGAEPGQVIAATVLYLFEQAEFGGTSFFRPLAPPAVIDRLVHDSGVMSAAQFTANYRIQPGYMSQSNAWFEKTLTIPARFNRLLVYDGLLFHCADLRAPELLSADPLRGRLTWNGFFTCSGNAR